MSELAAFVSLGFRHILDPNGADHMVFLLALAAIYRPSDWRQAVWVVTAFTVGHSITLALAVTDTLLLPTAWIEFLIPVTIVATGLENLLIRDRVRSARRWRSRPLFSGVFGLVHGAGFANYLRSLFADRVAVPLFGFNLGIELGQVLVLLVATVILVAVDHAVKRLSWTTRLSPVRLRVLGVSVVVILVASRWAVERVPW